MAQSAEQLTLAAVPIVAVLDLHANVSRRMTDNLSVFVGYLENPHNDIHERGIEAALQVVALLVDGRFNDAMKQLHTPAPK